MLCNLVHDLNAKVSSSNSGHGWEKSKILVKEPPVITGNVISELDGPLLRLSPLTLSFGMKFSQFVE